MFNSFEEYKEIAKSIQSHYSDLITLLDEGYNRRTKSLINSYPIIKKLDYRIDSVYSRDKIIFLTNTEDITMWIRDTDYTLEVNEEYPYFGKIRRWNTIKGNMIENPVHTWMKIILDDMNLDFPVSLFDWTEEHYTLFKLSL